MTALLSSHLEAAFLDLQRHEQDVARRMDAMLGAICFSTRLQQAPTSPSLTFASVPMPPLGAGGGNAAVCEAWCANGKLSRGQADGISYGHNDDMLFGVVQLTEAQAEGRLQTDKTPLQQVAESAYRAIFSLTARLKFPVILRFWNYIADINGESHGLERYRQFNMGRQDGFKGSGHQVEGSVVPAASAVGFADGPFTVCFLASRSATAIAIENPRQVSAYHYPAQYGPRSPTFSRASVARLGDADVLFISGTASIVGHRTMHAGDAAAQTREIVANLAAIIEQANLAAPGNKFALSNLCCKVYVRHETDVAAVRNELRRSLGASARLLFLKADICRRDLLVEVEATAGHPAEFAVLP